MSNPRTSIAALVALTAMMSGPTAPRAQGKSPASAPSAGQLEVVVAPRNTKGRVGCLLFASNKGFPGDSKRALARLQVRIVKVKGKPLARCLFAKLKPATYAVAVLHDENGNGKMDKSFFGIPKEGYGASNDAKPGTFSGPKFKDARFRYDGKGRRMRLLLRY